MALPFGYRKAVNKFGFITYLFIYLLFQYR